MCRRSTRAVLWEEAIRGLSATTFWVWERTDDPKSDFAGSLLHRPEIVGRWRTQRSI